MSANSYPVKSQDTTSFFENAPHYDRTRGNLVVAGSGAVYTVSMMGLYTLWYSDYPLSSFRYFDDSGEWLQVDKAGHLGSAYYLGKWSIDLVKWTGAKKSNSIIYGGAMSLAFLTTIEIFDGFSSQWGFSKSDMVANAAGIGLAMGQEWAWNEQRIKIKFSYHETKYPAMRPDQLGSKSVEKIFKDYNGQTYWISANIHDFLPENSGFPSWLNIAFGYGAEGMTGALDNDSPLLVGKPPLQRSRQFYIAPDVDLTKIKTRSHLLKTFLGVFGFIKFPAPAIEFRENGKPVYHLIYF